MPLRDRPKEERRAYHAEANRQWRAKAKASEESGSPEPSAAAIRAALADAAIIILASGRPGRRRSSGCWVSRSPGSLGVAGTVTAKARSGRLKPKVSRPTSSPADFRRRWSHA